MDAIDIQTHKQRIPPVCPILETKSAPLNSTIQQSKPAQHTLELLPAARKAALVFASLTLELGGLETGEFAHVLSRGL